MICLVYYESVGVIMTSKTKLNDILIEESNLKNWHKHIDDFIAGDASQKKEISEKVNNSYGNRQWYPGLPNPPKSLYRYFKFDKEGYWLKNIKGYLHLAPPTDWNDLSDSICSAELYDDLSDDEKKVADVYSKNRYACCFTEQIDYQPHWAYYADNHQGYAIEYNFTTRNRYAPLPIYYTKKTISLDSIKEL